MLEQHSSARRLGLARSAAALVAAGVLLTGCGGGDDAGDSAASPAASSPTAQGTRVDAELTEFAITLGQETFAPGTYTFVAKELGEAPHALSIEGPGVETVSTDVLQPGDAAASVTVDLQPGTYTLWCPVGSHRDQGMETSITVE